MRSGRSFSAAATPSLAGDGLDHLDAGARQEVAHDAPVLLVVLDDQDALFHALLRLPLHPERHGEMEGRPLSECRFHPEAPAVQLHDSPRDREPEPGAARLPGAGAVSLLELLEDLLLVGLGDPGARIRHRDDDGAVRRPGLDRDLAGVGELDRVAGEVQQHLGEPPLVAPARRQIGRDDRLEGELLAGGEGLHRRDHGVNDLPHGVVAERERELPRLHLGEVEHVVDQAEEVLSVGLDPLERLADRRGHVPEDVIQDEVGIAQHGVHRRAQLVAHVGEELGLVPARELELSALLLDLLEQAGVLDSDRGLRGEGMQQVHRVGRNRRPAHAVVGGEDARRCGLGRSSG